MNFSKEFAELIEEGKINEYLQKHGKHLYFNGSLELIEATRDGVSYWLNLDVQDDFFTPIYQVRVGSDEDLEKFDRFFEAFAYYKKRLTE